MEDDCYESEEAATASMTKLKKNQILEGPFKVILKNEFFESGVYWVYFSLK